MSKRRRGLVAAAGTLGLAVAAVWLAPACGAVNRQLDHQTLRSKAALVERRGARESSSPLPFHDAATLERLTRARPLAELRAAPLRRHRLPERGLIQEELTFRSAVRLRHPESDEARLLVYRRGRLGERPVVIWAPGQYVSDGAFFFLRRFFDEILRQGADVVFYEPPYHLERTPRGFDSGDAVLATDVADHLAVFAQALSDLRSVTAWLRGQGVAIVGGFGGSLGATVLLRLSTWDDGLDFLTVMIPVVRWDLIIDRPEMAPVRARLGAGDGLARLREAYAALDPTGDVPRLPAARVSILYGRYDLVAPAGPILALARRWRVERVRAYDRGHSLMLVSRSLYGDAGRLLGEDLRAVAGPRAAPRPPRASRTALAPAAASAYTISSRISTWPTFDSPAP